MNQRIRELARTSHLDVYGLGKDRAKWEDSLEKFAELIIADCLQIVNRKEYSYHEADPLWETAQLIKEHFGVEL